MGNALAVTVKPELIEVCQDEIRKSGNVALQLVGSLDFIEISFWWLRLNVADLRVLAVPNSKVWIARFGLLRQYSDMGLLFSLGLGELFEKCGKGSIVGLLTRISPLCD